MKYGSIAAEKRFFFSLSYIDVYDRSIVGYHIGLKCEGVDAARTLEQALWKRKLLEEEIKPVIRTDNGPQFKSRIFQKKCQSLKIEHERIRNRTPNMNAHIEAFHSILEAECLSLYEFQTYAEAYKVVSDFIKFSSQPQLMNSQFGNGVKGERSKGEAFTLDGIEELAKIGIQLREKPKKT
ncbi:hypothetical protein ULO1_04580 [Carboxydocella sp. ULO1]|nr:hypothetical protein ULO1_04580 [Carboxydocella sp. ULO1]